MSVYKILQEVANDPSKNAKIAILTANKDNDDLETVCRLAYDPTVNFYIKKVPAYKATGAGALGVALFSLEQEIASRKRTGNNAIEYVTRLLEGLNEEDADVLARVIGRDLRCGFSDSTANKVWKNLIPEFPYMRCSLPKAVDLSKFSWASGVYSQLKADGMYANINHDADGNVAILSRQGSQFPIEAFADLVADVQATFPVNTQSHGELLVERDGVVLPRQIGNGILNSVSKGGSFAANEKPVYMVWDQISLSSVVSKGVYNVLYSDRFNNLVMQVQDVKSIIIIPTEVVYSMADAMRHYREMLAEGLEGTIIKHNAAIWKDGTSKEQVKLKLETVVDLVIVGFNAGKGKNENTFGSIICQSSCGKLEVGVSGFTDAARAEIWFNRDNVIGKIMAVKSNSIMPPSDSNSLYSLFLPRCEEIRDDKTTADDLQRIIDQFESAVKV